MQPNLFQCATKELTQDGFLTWLLLWADPQNQQNDKNLHEAACAFVKFLIQKQTQAPDAITAITAGKKGVLPQGDKLPDVDVWALVNNKFLIIIEDKTATGPHSNQLARYKEQAEKICRENNYTPVFIYLKTGPVSHTDLLSIEKKEGYATVVRAELLQLWAKNTVKNSIFTDFYQYLAHLEAEEKLYETLPIKDWTGTQWIGFYKFLETQIPQETAGWNYVSNPKGGFWGYWFTLHAVKDYEVYLQIEENALCFKLYDATKAGQEHFYQALMQLKEQYGLPEIQKPQRMRCGTTATAALIPNWLGDADKPLNQAQALAKIQKCITLLQAYINASQNGI